jgi:hypothetical protein
MASTEPSVLHAPEPHVHVVDEICPLCDQPIPADKLVQIQQRERQRADAQAKQLRDEFAKEKAAAREEAKKQAEAAMRAKLSEVEQLKKVAENQLEAAQAEQDERLQQELEKQRESLAKANQAALMQKEAEHFRDREKHLKTIEQLKRQLERKPADELGEGAEIDLYEALREAFEADRIKRIDKGVPGADVWHDVVHNGEVCGRIVYDSKNHGGWRWSFVTKLREDQLAAEADHAVLATGVFPSGESQLHVHDGVVIANPARVVAIVTILREHVTQTYRLRLSDQERDAKMSVLYNFINSERCNQLFMQFDSLIKEMDDLEVGEKKAHDKTWNKRGQLMKNMQKVIQGQLRAELDRIIEDGSRS